MSAYQEGFGEGFEERRKEIGTWLIEQAARERAQSIPRLMTARLLDKTAAELAALKQPSISEDDIPSSERNYHMKGFHWAQARLLEELVERVRHLANLAGHDYEPQKARALRQIGERIKVQFGEKPLSRR